MKCITKIDNVEYNSNGDLILSLKINGFQAKLEAQELEKGKEYILQIEDTEKRNNTQNSYLWGLIKQVSIKLNQSDETTYLTLLKASNAKYEYIGAIPDAIKSLKKVFRVVELVDERDKMNVYRCYYGSSKMSKKEFSLLMENLLAWCEELDIETDPKLY